MPREITIQQKPEIKYTIVPVVPYQCCPVCNATGKTVADGFTSSVFWTCRVCNGARIIPMHIVSAQY